MSISERTSARCRPAPFVLVGALVLFTGACADDTGRESDRRETTTTQTTGSQSGTTTTVTEVPQSTTSIQVPTSLTGGRPGEQEFDEDQPGPTVGQE